MAHTINIADGAKVNDLKVEAYDLFAQINRHLATANELKRELARVEEQIAKLEKGGAQDGQKQPES